MASRQPRYPAGGLLLLLFRTLAASLLLTLLLGPATTPAQAASTTTAATADASSTSTSSGALAIYSPTSKYNYYGCYNETTDLPGTARERALDGTHQTSPGTMTVQACLDFCSSNGTLYKFAGLEFSRECWCGNHLTALSAKFSDSECNTACDGNASIACGGPLKLSVYMARAPSLPGAVTGLLTFFVAASILGNIL